MSGTSGTELEAALVGLIAELEGGGFEAAAQQAGARASEAIDAVPPGSLSTNEQQRVKRLHSLALALLETRREEINTEIKRVGEARQLLRSCLRPVNEDGPGGDVDISG